MTRRAFTLLEVMLATIIIGLGVLGLTALFAGAAKQQVDTARLADGVALGQSVESVLRSRLGVVRTGWPTDGSPNSTTNFTGGQYEHGSGNGLNVPLVETIWYPLSAYPAKVNDTRWPAHALALDPRTTVDLNAELRLFMVVPGPREVVLYENPLDTTSAAPAPVYGPAPAMLAIDRPTWEYVSGEADGQGANSSATTPEMFAPVTGFSRVARLPHGRIHPGSLRVRVEIARQARNTGGALVEAVGSRRSVIFDDAPFFSEADDDNAVGPDGPWPAQAYGIAAAGGAGRMAVVRYLDPPNAAAQPPDTRAFIDHIATPLMADEWVERIVVERYAYRADRLMSLDERVRRNTDGRTSVGAAVFLQSALGGGQRAAVLTYSAEPLGGPFPDSNPPEFIPPESGPGGAGAERLLETVRLRLVFDENVGQAYVTPQTPTNPPTFAVDVGDLILISGDPTNAGGAGTTAGESGADGFCRVIRNDLRTGAGTENRSYLDVVPRAGGRPIVGPQNAPIAPPSSAQVRAWTLRPIVESLQDYVIRPNATPRRVKWKIEPIEARVISGGGS